MFPIIPSHLLRQPAPVCRTSESSRTTIWNIWTDSNVVKKKESPPVNCSSSDKLSKQHQMNDIEHHHQHNTTSEATSSKCCIATTFLQKDIKSKSFDVLELSALKNFVKPKIMLKISASGYLQTEDKLPERIWVKNVKLSNDTYSNNALLEITSNRQLRIRIIKSVRPDEEVLLWFSEEILALMYIPFLSPANIRGKNCYTCNVCDKSYESPNPLKIHMATNCDRYTQDDLWCRLELSIPKPYVLHTRTEPSLQLALLSQHQTRLPTQLNTDNNLRPDMQNPHLPIPPASVQHFQRNRCLLSQQNSAFQSILLPTRYQTPNEHVVIAPQDNVTATAAAQLETIVSNMGTSKQGHLCIYCGKLYSRKYGLKIHIRTHTGFKPLKCRYCFRPFGDPSNLNKHVRLHVQGNSLYKCKICGKILIRRRDLQRHMQTKHDAKNIHHRHHRIDGSDKHENSSNEVSLGGGDSDCSVSSNNNCNDIGSSSSSDNDDKEFDQIEVD